MIASSGLFTENIYKRLLPGRTAKHYVFVARVASLIIVAGGVGFAYRLEGVVEGLEIFWKISPMMGIAFWLGLFWRRTTVAGAWASTLTAFGVWWLTTQEFFISWLGNLSMAESLTFVFVKNGAAEVYLPWQMVFYLSAGTIAGIVVSLFTRPVSEKSSIISTRWCERLSSRASRYLYPALCRTMLWFLRSETSFQIRVWKYKFHHVHRWSGSWPAGCA